MNSKLMTLCYSLWSGWNDKLGISRCLWQFDFPIRAHKTSHISCSMLLLELLLIFIHQLVSIPEKASPSLRPSLTRESPRNFNWCLPLRLLFFLLTTADLLTSSSSLLCPRMSEKKQHHCRPTSLIDSPRDWPFGHNKKINGFAMIDGYITKIWFVTRRDVAVEYNQQQQSWVGEQKVLM